MGGSWESTLVTLVVLAGLTAPGSSQIVEGPSNATVVVGGTARFNCTVSQGWRLIMWALDGTVVLSVTPKEPIITNDRFTSASYEAGDNFISEMLIQDVQPADEGKITCSLQSVDRVAWAFLSVQVVGTLAVPETVRAIRDQPCNVTCRASGWAPLPDLSWEVGVPNSEASYSSAPDPEDPHSSVSVLTLTPEDSGSLTCVAHAKGLSGVKSATVNLTVDQSDSVGTAGTSLPTWAIALLAVSFSLLLVLIVVLIVICCCCTSRREKAESTYQSEIRQSAAVKTSETLDGGRDNYSYSSEPTGTTEAASAPPKSGASTLAQGQHSDRPAAQSLDPQCRTGLASRPHVSFHATSPRTVRSATLV